MLRALAAALVLAACGARAPSPPTVANGAAAGAGCPGDAPVRACEVDAGGVTVEAGGLPPGGAVEVSLDVTYVHASAACHGPWTRTAVADATGAVRVRFAIAPTDDCALHGEMQAWTRALPDGADAASPPFVVPAR